MSGMATSSSTGPGPRLAETVEILAEILHPDTFDFGHRRDRMDPNPGRLVNRPDGLSRNRLGSVRPGPQPRGHSRTPESLGSSFTGSSSSSPCRITVSKTVSPASLSAKASAQLVSVRNRRSVHSDDEIPAPGDPVVSHPPITIRPPQSGGLSGRPGANIDYQIPRCRQAQGAQPPPGEEEPFDSKVLCWLGSALDKPQQRRGAADRHREADSDIAAGAVKSRC